jgi:predicted transcriptional regulator
MTAIVIGIMPQEKIRERVLAIARGAYKPKPGEPKIWFTSMKSLAEVLSDDNRALLQAIREVNPESRLAEYLVLISLV